MRRQVLYVSKPVDDEGDAGLDAILVASRRSNTEIGVTGLLTFIDGQFVQVLERDASIIDFLIDTIGADPRHTKLRILADRAVETKHFGRWAMANVNLDPAALRRINELARSAARSRAPACAAVLIDTLAHRALDEAATLRAGR